MSHDPKQGDPRRADTGEARAPSPSELFCIYSYAGESGPPCGWRGPARETVRSITNGARRCPRCGRATLMEIPSVAEGE